MTRPKAKENENPAEHGISNVYVTHLQLSKALETQSEKLTSQFASGFDRVLNKLDSVQSHTDAKIDNEVASIYKRIDRESSQQLSHVEKLRDDRKITSPIIVATVAVIITVIGGLGRWMQVTAGKVEVQEAIMKVRGDFQSEFREETRMSIKKEDERNERQDSEIQALAIAFDFLSESLKDEIRERQALELRTEEHAVDGHPERIEGLINEIRRSNDERLEVIEEMIRARGKNK